MHFKTFTVNPLQQNTTLVHDESSAILFDAGFYEQREFDELNSFLLMNQLTLRAVYLTHAHIDHIFGVDRLQDEYQIPIYLHLEEFILLENAPMQAELFGLKLPKIQAKVSVMDLKNVNVGEMSFSKLLTPGHSPGHISYYFEDSRKLIAGDTLFNGSIGRTDLYKGDFNVLKESIESQLYVLPEEVEVFPGHGPNTTIGHEKLTNPYVRG